MSAEQDRKRLYELENSCGDWSYEEQVAMLGAAKVLQRISEWDAWDMADQWPLGDAPYFKREIKTALDNLFGALRSED